MPVIDPDVIAEGHVRSNDPEDTAHRIWSQRRSSIEDQLLEIADVLGQPRTPEDFDRPSPMPA